MAARFTSRFKQKPAIPFGDFMLPILGVITLGILVAGIRLLWAPAANQPVVIAQPRLNQSRVSESNTADEPAESVVNAESAQKETLRDVEIAQPVQRRSETKIAEEPAAQPKTQQRVTRVEPKKETVTRTEPSRTVVRGGSIDKSQFIVQCGSYTDRSGANAVVNSLRKIGYSAVVRQADVRGKTYYRVIVAGGADRATAGEIADRIKAAGHPVLVRSND